MQAQLGPLILRLQIFDELMFQLLMTKQWRRQCPSHVLLADDTLPDEDLHHRLLALPFRPGTLQLGFGDETRLEKNLNNVVVVLGRGEELEKLLGGKLWEAATISNGCPPPHLAEVSNGA